MAGTSKEVEAQDEDENETKNKAMVLKRVRCIHYLLCFWKDLLDVEALLDSGSEVNAMTPALASKLGLKVCSTNIGAQKIDGSTFQTLGMVLASFQVDDKLERVRFSQESFLLADTTAQIMLDIPFLTLSNADVSFLEQTLT